MLLDNEKQINEREREREIVYQWRCLSVKMFKVVSINRTSFSCVAVCTQSVKIDCYGIQQKLFLARVKWQGIMSEA